jgi:fibronectin type 3 domain-containing protein
VEGANKYFVYRSLSKEGIYTYQGSSEEAHFLNSSAEAGYCYYYKVKAINTENEFVKSNDSNICYITCDLPQPVVDICLHFGKPRVSWEAVPGASKYEVYRKVGEEGNYSKYFTTTSTFMTNTSAEAGQTYYYKVVAVCPVSSYGNSVYSNEVCITAEPF